MEHKSLHGTDDADATNKKIDFSCSKDNVEDVQLTSPCSPRNDRQVNLTDIKEGGVGSISGSVDEETSGDVNMEATVMSDDVIKAGGFGARDDISSFLPVASDSTDFEATIRDARDYEEQQGEIRRPGLGWTEATERK